VTLIPHSLVLINSCVLLFPDLCIASGWEGLVNPRETGWETHWWSQRQEEASSEWRTASRMQMSVVRVLASKTDDLTCICEINPNPIHSSLTHPLCSIYLFNLICFLTSEPLNFLPASFLLPLIKLKVKGFLRSLAHQAKWNKVDQYITHHTNQLA
jgi:hypothetical protein